MVHLIVQLSKYIMIILFLIYTFLCFHLFKYPAKAGVGEAGPPEPGAGR